MNFPIGEAYNEDSPVVDSLMLQELVHPTHGTHGRSYLHSLRVSGMRAAWFIAAAGTVTSLLCLALIVSSLAGPGREATVSLLAILSVTFVAGWLLLFLLLGLYRRQKARARDKTSLVRALTADMVARAAMRFYKADKANEKLCDEKRRHHLELRVALRGWLDRLIAQDETVTPDILLQLGINAAGHSLDSPPAIMDIWQRDPEGVWTCPLGEPFIPSPSELAGVGEVREILAENPGLLRPRHDGSSACLLGTMVPEVLPLRRLNPATVKVLKISNAIGIPFIIGQGRPPADRLSCVLWARYRDKHNLDEMTHAMKVLTDYARDMARCYDILVMALGDLPDPTQEEPEHSVEAVHKG